MATSITIKAGTLTSVVSTTNDTKGQNILRNFALATGADAALPNHEMLDHVVKQLSQYMQHIARELYVQMQSATIVTDADTNVAW